jgi:predicted DNA-binding transcriptional regulator AlpA
VTDDQTYIKEAKLAEQLNEDQRTTRRRRNAGTGPEYVRIGRAVRYTREAIDRWIAQRTFRSVTEERSQRESPDCENARGRHHD